MLPFSLKTRKEKRERYASFVIPVVLINMWLTRLTLYYYSFCNISWMARRLYSAKGILQAKNHPCWRIRSYLSKRHLFTMTFMQMVLHRWIFILFLSKIIGKILIWTIIYILSVKKKEAKYLQWEVYIYIHAHTRTIAIFLAIISYSCGNMTSILKKLSQVKIQPAEQVTFKYSAIEEY